MPLRAPKGFIDESDPRVSQIGHPAPAWLISYADLMTELVSFFIILYALSASLNKNVQSAAQQVKSMIEKNQLNGEVNVDREGLKITLEERGGVSFFQSGLAETTPEIDAAIAKLAPVLRGLAAGHDIMVEGHTDDQPISNEFFDSNWELSTARATSVARLLIDRHGFPASRIGATGYGQFRPVAPNNSPERRAENRRVVIFIKSVSAAKPKAPPLTR